MEEMARPKIEIVRVPSIERSNFRPLDGVQLRAAYSHVRIGTYCPEPEPELPVTPRRDVKPPIEQSRKYKKNLGPVSRLLRRRQHATSLATKSCDNIYSVNKSNSFFEWKHSHEQATVIISSTAGLHTRQSNSLDWRVNRSVDRNSSSLDYRKKASRSAEQLQTPSTKSKLVSLLRRLSPRLPRPSSKGSLPSSPSICPWLQVEYSSGDIDGTKIEQKDSTDYSFQRELQLNEMRKRAIQASRETTARNVCPTVQIQEAPDEHPSLRAVHEDRGSSEERSSSQEQQEEPPLPPSRTTRRSRPHSLAVQPLNYQRFDPDQPPPQVLENRQPEAPASVQAAAVTVRQPNMTSQESIGSCSLDVDKSASDRSEVNAGSLSEKTLHSLNLSTCNGEPTIRVTEPPPPESNGHESHEPDGGEDGSDGVGEQQLTAKKPSYLGLACSISGYSGITRYDSKLREGFRSRDSSPGSRLIHRDTSPAGFRSNETLNLPTSAGNQQPTKSQSISPLAMERQHNGFANGAVKHKIDNYHESSRVIGSCQGYSEVDRGIPAGHAAALEQLSPIRASSPNKRDSPVGMRIAAYNQQNKSYSSISSSSPKSFSVNVSHTSYSETSILNGSSDHEGGFNSSASSEKSFIQQRVERLYGPGALAQGFFFKRSSKHDFSHDSSANKSSSNNNNSSVHETSVEESLKNLPVLRHLRPEFRAQLPVVSPRRPTDGTEQIIKPLKRISLSTGKNDAKEIKASPIKQESNNATSDVKMTASVTSLTDQQPAAPKVVLPVLEPSASLTNIPKQGAETPKKVQEKDGHYFMSVLDKERKRLIVLAEGAEAELSGSGASALPEEAAGKLRSAAGKARLLASQKMKQFEGLCQKNINQVPGEEFPTTSEDLAGFWDMVMLQVVQVNDLFEQLDRSRKLQWQEVAPEQKPTPATPHNGSAIKRRQTPASKAKSAANAEAARKAREAREQTRRQLLEERRRAMRSSAGKPNNSVEMFLPET
ncbi:hypothetical protein TSAR_012401 [Trichomalopsis sarcophagae]|uniref:Disks large-associated protein 4 n=1 Tax=Trichomalopsis sarcophagae TaxID=543379 RepID=A0A232F541_9HYME|nr:hypothetical protein TSAR_012401 [Trichomalopsis sarcophagae]